MTATNYPPVVVVDENDNEIGTAMLAEVWQKGLYHRVAAVFVFDDQGRMLLQKRGPDVKVYANCWDQAAGGHVDAGQSYGETAADELAEELGLRKISLESVGTYRANHRDGERIINQFERVFRAVIPTGTALSPELAELAELRWFTPAELKQLIARQPDGFTPGLLYDLRHYFPEFSPDSLLGMVE